MDKRVIAMMPLRADTSEIPSKNTRIMAGKPLFCWALDAALQAKMFDQIVVSTESNAIADLVRALYPTVEILQRPEKLADPDVSLDKVIMHLAKYYTFETLAILSATTPLLKPTDLIQAYAKFLHDDLKSLVAVVRQNRHFWDQSGQPLTGPADLSRKQDEAEPVWMENGAFYFCSRQGILDQLSRFSPPVGFHEMTPETAILLDSETHWHQVETYLSQTQPIATADPHSTSIKRLFCNISGTLSDGRIHPSGEVLQTGSCHCHDLHALKKLQNQGIPVILISGNGCDNEKAFYENLGCEAVFTNLENKLLFALRYCADHDLSIRELAYIGDDENDLDLLNRCGFSGAPSDADDAVLKTVDYVCTKPGGLGAVREFAEKILFRHHP